MNKYMIERELGHGGMGVVVAAVNMAVDQRVALKFLTGEGARSPSSVERFTREARASGKLRSEHVAKVFDVGWLDSGSPYIVMELLEGRDLKAILADEGPMPVTRAVDYMLQAIDAVAEAHKVGIVHRDLKPANLFLTTRIGADPIIKLLDFGISKFQDGADDDSGDRVTLTMTSAFLGSPAYASPEQCRSPKYVDGRSDIWSLGAMLYELLTAARPFRGGSEAEVFAAVLEHEPRPMRSLRRDTPPTLENIVSRCLRKDPAARFPTVAELAVALVPFGSGRWSHCAERAVSLSGSESLRASFLAQDVPIVTAPSVSVSGVRSTPSRPLAVRSSRRTWLAVPALLLVVAAAAFLATRKHEVPTEPPSATAGASASAPASLASAPASSSKNEGSQAETAAPPPAQPAAKEVPAGSVRPRSRDAKKTAPSASAEGHPREAPSVGTLLETRQ